jgi:hypothetical protein
MIIGRTGDHAVAVIMATKVEIMATKVEIVVTQVEIMMTKVDNVDMKDVIL